MKHSITSKFISLFIIGLFFILVPNFTKAADSSAEGITLSPPLTELTIQKGKQASGTIKLTNPLAKMVELYSSTADFLPQGETGGQRFLAPTSENRSFSLASWISLAKEKSKSPSAKATGDAPVNMNWLSRKPIIYAANVSEKDANLSTSEIIKKFNLDFITDPEKLIVISAQVEQDLIDLNEIEQKEYLESLGLKKSGLDRLIQSAYHTLGLQSYFTAGSDEVRAWTIKIGDTAPIAAGKIHTDFEHGFIRAQVVSYDDYSKYNGEAGAKQVGKLRQEGKDYIVQDGDVIEFLFSARG